MSLLQRATLEPGVPEQTEGSPARQSARREPREGGHRRACRRERAVRRRCRRAARVRASQWQSTRLRCDRKPRNRALRAWRANHRSRAGIGADRHDQ
eukprot:1496413-Pleurochrysis_carterae.AAC.1